MNQVLITVTFFNQPYLKSKFKLGEEVTVTGKWDPAKQAVSSAKKQSDIVKVMEDLLKEGKASLKRTPDLLPVLKEVGVVDSGGQGLIYIYEGFLAILRSGEVSAEFAEESNAMDTLIKVEHHAQSHMQGVKAGVVINPATSVSVLEPILDDVDLILFMTVNPGFGGQSFIHSVLPKIEAVAKLVAEKELEVEIEVDGGVNAETA